jgi:hypothetical protein
MTTTTHPAVAEYVGRIQAALADLPEAEVEEIVEDIGQHLYVFGPDGKPVPDAYLYDQDGRPISVWPPACGYGGPPTNK